ncbi:hypothetical protein [Paraburkholderia diazotrophica]|uniref:Uncharacterized protein n=1 Tax=Paraburkholderia diazotrophica TaxID=667676 RepID=A0A1H6QDN8_9BURK|nr:hypothetical protein [Paraburkholderia diazotrophica]SEI41808.1 hypothetical protein SAMN05192539_1001278 [Paraburkholderia diazotrophica]
MPYVNVYVDAQDVLDDMSDDDLAKEMRKRDIPYAGDTDEAKVDLEKVFYAFYFGKEHEAVALMRKYVQDVTGRTLP